MLLICGSINSGKTTLSKHFSNVLHYDDFIHARTNASEWVKSCNEAVANADEDVCVEGIYYTREQRMSLLEACKDKHRKVCIFMDVPKEDCMHRRHNRYPPSYVSDFYGKVEPPTLDEGWDEIIYISNVMYKANGNNNMKKGD